MNHLTATLKKYRDEERGSIAIETMILLPALFLVFLSMFAIFHAYRQHAITQKAAYTIGDIISRETTPIDSDYMGGAREMLAYLTATIETDVAIRITSVKYDAIDDVYERVWSQSRGWLPPLSKEDVAGMANRLPVMPDNDYVVLVETSVEYDPPFKTGLSERRIENFVFTRPRYAPRVCWVTCNPET